MSNLLKIAWDQNIFFVISVPIIPRYYSIHIKNLKLITFLFEYVSNNFP